MTNEEFDRKAEFLLNQQAKFDAEMIELKAAQARTDKAVTRLIETVSSLTRIVFDSFKLLADSHKSLAELHKSLAESQKLTDEKLRNLAALVDRHIREGHLGAET